ncbi:putative metal-dependent phosphoesterase, PHP family [Thermanaerovibrio velox DSM 12556]|uniref:Putative metal-dependent phosphoesterase, PHP family n=1 Tax=Thermanaerovibrio velox DSM 12556 TaxID=926567 RepID=H0UNS1_9BACT|nr:PHP domain-containing protein [Thermanaerovibrio velox]EHM09407.1 putative metal-dependent phosphoesterase, PHP family [Thermanaerovibrio velox DSM 12556]
MIWVDLHLHSTCSDGTVKPSDLPKLGRRLGLSVMALTDHDTTDGNEEFLRSCRRHRVKGIPGVEVSAEAPYTLHVLGYRVSSGGPLEEALAWVREGREERNHRICSKLSALGVPVSMEEARSEAGSDLVGRPHIARVLVRKGYASDPMDAFNRFLGRGAPAYVSRRRLSPGDAIDLIRQSGGLAVMAHPLQTGLGWDDLYRLVVEMRSMGLWGVECFHSSASREDSLRLFQMCAELSLVPTGGSDFHGENKPWVSMGVPVEPTWIPWARLGVDL